MFLYVWMLVQPAWPNSLGQYFDDGNYFHTNALPGELAFIAGCRLLYPFEGAEERYAGPGCPERHANGCALEVCWWEALDCCAGVFRL